MKKAILYLFFLGLFFSNTQANAASFFEGSGVKTAIHKAENKKDLRDRFSRRTPFSHKSRLLNDYDDDRDEYDGEDYSTSVKDKLLFFPIVFVATNQSTATFVRKTCCDKIYHHVNFSRLPRFNYISLRVLRL